MRSVRNAFATIRKYSLLFILLSAMGAAQVSLPHKKLHSTSVEPNEASAVRAQATRRAETDELRAIRSYIQKSWHTLTRSNENLAAAAVDPKFPLPADGRWPVYVSNKENIAAIESSLRKQMSPADFSKIEIRQLAVIADQNVTTGSRLTATQSLSTKPKLATGPLTKKSLERDQSLPTIQSSGDQGLSTEERLVEDRGQADPAQEPGLLYLPHPYVVPGGRFNEMYGWDSYFIQVGLLRDGELKLARNVVDNFIYQIEHYGQILNANRTYYLTRSQPPFLTGMILNVYRHTRDKKWLENSLPAIDMYYRYWTTGPHLSTETGLSRYYDSGDGPAPEVVADERDEQGRTHYDRVKEYFRTHEVTDYDERDYYDPDNDLLTELFYKGDRAMRESGFDPSNRFGQFNADILNYNPVCLNSLLYLMETETAEIHRIIGHRAAAAVWLRRARERRARMNQLMWDKKDGLYYDYNFKTGKVRRYPFVTTFYTLWTGIADRRQAARIARNLSLFERAGGLQTSTNPSGSQWDAPFGWAPMQMIAVAGLRRYGYHAAANRISVNFLSLILKEFKEHNVIVEKYDVERRDSQVRSGLKFGYTSNEIGFGWTNAAFVELYANLPEDRRSVGRGIDD